MFFISFFRAIKFSLQDIIRNFWLSLVTVVILILALFLVNILVSVRVITQSAINSTKEKVDINLDLVSSASESDIMALKASVSNLNNAGSVTYISMADALETFKESNKNHPEVLQALRELNKNPLNPVLVIKPKDVGQYDSLINDLNKINNPIIEAKNFENPKELLGKINSIAKKVNEISLFISLIFIFITILVVYNSIRVTIYTHQKEINIMRLVGASNWFIKAPFFISSVIYTLIALAITISLFYPFLGLLQPYLETFFKGYTINIIDYFKNNFLIIAGAEFLVASMVNIFASFVAVRKYSKV